MYIYCVHICFTLYIHLKHSNGISSEKIANLSNERLLSVVEEVLNLST